MNKFLSFLLIIVICFSITSCGYNNIQIETRKFVSEDGIVVVEYPIISNKTEQTEAFNSNILDFVSKICEDFLTDETNCSYVKIDSSVFIAGNVISVLFEGEANYSEAAHPINVAYSINYSLNDSKTIALEDFFEGKSVDDIADCVLNNEIISELYNKTDVMKYINDYSDMDSQVCYYKTQEGMFITIPVPHVVGDYVKIKID